MPHKKSRVYYNLDLRKAPRTLARRYLDYRDSLLRYPGVLRDRITRDNYLCSPINKRSATGSTKKITAADAVTAVASAYLAVVPPPLLNT